MDYPHDQDGHNSHCCSDNYLGLRQSLPEIEFERGIWFAAQYNDLDRVHFLLKKGISVDVEDSAGYRALHYAARNGHYKICEVLLKNGANINACTRCGQATALHRAATQGHANIVELLLKFGADVNLKDTDGFTALHRAVLQVRIPVCNLLIPCTDLLSMDNNGRNIEQLAKEKCSAILPIVLEYVNKKKETVSMC